MMESTTLGELIAAHGGLIQTGPFGSQLHQSDYSEDGIPVVMPKDIRGGRVDENGIARVPEIKARSLSRHYLKPGSIVFPRRGEISKCAYIDEGRAGFLCGTGCFKIEPPEEVLKPKFLYYYLGLRHVVEWLERNAVGTTMLNLNTKIIGGIRIPHIPMQTQETVVSILSAYDDLIENNRRRIQLLEQAARLLYREWFVHLRFPGHEHVTITDGVPEGWERKELEGLCTLRAGGVFKPKYQGQTTGDYPFIKVRDMNSAGNGVSITEADNWVTSDTCSEFRGRPFPPGTSVFAKIGEGLRQNRVRFIVRDTLIDNNMMGAIPNRNVVDEPFIYYLLSNYDIASNASGAAVPFLSAKVLSKIRFLVPDLPTQHHFKSAIAPMLEQITNLQRQNTEAAKARDILLPRLMNGEVAV